MPIERVNGEHMRATNLFFLSLFLCLVLAGAPALGDGAVIILQNLEKSDFHFTVDPKGLQGLTAGSPLLKTKVAEIFAKQGDEPAFTTLAPDAQVRLAELSDGPHLLLGFFSVEDQDEFPVRVMTLQADSKIAVRFYAVFMEAALINVARGAGRLSGFARTTPQSATAGTTAESAAQAAPVQPAGASGASLKTARIARFTQSYNPVLFTREVNGELTVLPLGESRFWNLTGTRLTEVGGSLSSDVLALSLKVSGGFSENVSYYFYVFKTRTEGKENPHTIELRPRASGKTGAAFLWSRGQTAPRLIGSVTVSGTEAVLAIPLEKLPADAREEIGGSSTVDLTACWFDQASRTYEEFYYTTFSLSDLSSTAGAGAPTR